MLGYHHHSYVTRLYDKAHNLLFYKMNRVFSLCRTFRLRKVNRERNEREISSNLLSVRCWIFKWQMETPFTFPEARRSKGPGFVDISPLRIIYVASRPQFVSFNSRASFVEFCIVVPDALRLLQAFCPILSQFGGVLRNFDR